MLTAGQALFKLAAQQSKNYDHSATALALHLLTTPTFLIACLLYALSTIIWVALLGRFPLSQAYPVVIAASIILTTTLGITVFKEPLTSEKVFGLLLITAGVKVLSRSLT